MKYVLYPGCAGEATAREALAATRRLLDALDIDVSENAAFSCCGAGIVEEEDPEFEYTLNARNFALAEREGRDILLICNTCLLTMLKTQRRLAEDESLFQQVNEDLARIGLEYTGRARVTHLLWILRDEVGIERLAGLANAPIQNALIAPFYGCHILRPSDIIRDDKAPEFMDQLIEACGARVADYGDRYNCCGFHILLNDQETSLKMAARCLLNAQRCGADLLVTPCTLCHISLDGYQKEATKGEGIEIPVLHLAQMIGLAMGIDGKELGLNKNLVSAEKYY